MLYAAVDELRRIDGEKHLIFVSERGQSAARADDAVKLAQAAASARVVIHYVYTGGTRSIGAFDSGSITAARTASVLASGSRAVPLASGGRPDFRAETARILAGLTGGVSYWNELPSAAADFDAIDDVTGAQYVLGYYPSTHSPTVGGFRQIEVRVNRPGLTVLYRHGYTPEVRSATFDSEFDLINDRLQIAAAYPIPIDDISIRITPPSTSKTDTTIKTEFYVDPSGVRFSHEDGRNRASLVVAIWYLDKKGRVVGQRKSTVPVSLRDEELQTIGGLGIPISQDVPGTQAATLVKIVVYQLVGDRTGSAVEKVH
jgi:hypothetical protein